MKALLYIWQLPQTILGFLVLLFYARKAHKIGDGIWTVEGLCSGECFGEIILLQTWYGDKHLAHERGHRIQSRMLGPSYLISIGIPSAICNLIDRFFHKDWDALERNIWYYRLPWEEWADELGKVNRF